MTSAVAAARHMLHAAMAQISGEPTVSARSGSQLAENERSDLEVLVPPNAEVVLDVGCGLGYLGAALKRRGVGRVVGVELNPTAAREAESRIDEVLCLDVEKTSLPFPGQTFDCLIYGDILEHLIDPWAVVRDHRRLLKPDGFMLLSIPNVAYWRVLLDLLRGRWDYAPSGTLDATHLRFFTLRSIGALCRGAGLEASKVHTSLPAGGKSHWLNRLTAERLEHLLVWRYIVEARPKPEGP